MPSLALNASQTKILTPAKSKVASRGLRSLACWSGRLKRPSSSFLTDSQLMRANVLTSCSIWLELKAKRMEEKATPNPFDKDHAPRRSAFDAAESGEGRGSIRRAA